jgi:DNA-binding NtrC family response regulator
MSDTQTHAPADVLIVDDDPKIRELLRLWLLSDGYTVHEAPDAASGLALLSEKPIAVMTIDKDMPGHDGVWLVEQVQQTHPGIAMLLASGDDRIPMRVAMSRGIQGYLVKPLKRDAVTGAVKAALAWHEAAKSQSASAHEPPARRIDEWLQNSAGRKPPLAPEPDPKPE